MAVADKLFVQESDLLIDGYRLGRQIFDSGFRPDFMVGIWRGGSSVGIAVQECLQYLGVETDHIAIRTSYRGAETYHEVIANAEGMRVHGLQYLFETMNAEDRFLIVDDVYSTGLNVDAVIRRIQDKMRRNLPREIRIAVPWFKPAYNRTGRVPDYYLHETDKWLVLPYELTGLSPDEIRRHKPGLVPILDELEPWIAGRRGVQDTPPVPGQG